MRILLSLIGLLASCALFAQTSESERSTWVNEAIVSVYTFDYENFFEQQKKIAHYFEPKAWMTYSAALAASKLDKTVEKNKFYVSAVAQSTPEIKSLSTDSWVATMPLLVVYKNKTTEQRQTLLVTIGFKLAPESEGVRNLEITSFESKAQKPTCSCYR